MEKEQSLVSTPYCRRAENLTQKNNFPPNAAGCQTKWAYRPSRQSRILVSYISSNWMVTGLVLNDWRSMIPPFFPFSHRLRISCQRSLKNSSRSTRLVSSFSSREYSSALTGFPAERKQAISSAFEAARPNRSRAAFSFSTCSLPYTLAYQLL